MNVFLSSGVESTARRVAPAPEPPHGYPSITYYVVSSSDDVWLAFCASNKTDRGRQPSTPDNTTQVIVLDASDPADAALLDIAAQGGVVGQAAPTAVVDLRGVSTC